MILTARPDDLNSLYRIASEFQIISYYLGITELPCIINAPYRPDRKPSLSIFQGMDGHIRFKDQARGDSGRVLDLLSLMWACTAQEAFRRLCRDLSDIRRVPDKKKLSGPVSGKQGSPLSHQGSDVRVKTRDWRPYDYEFWEKQGVDKWFLDISNTYPISTIFFIREGKTTSMPADKYAYVYVEFKDGNPTIKIYQPFSDRLKWISKHDRSVWDLWTLLPERGNHLVITSSRKDAMCVWCCTGTPSTSLQGEGYVPKPHVISSLKQRFENIHVLFDNDFNKEINYGRMYSEKLCDEYSLHQIEIPSLYKSKDPSDLTKNHGRKLATRVLRDMIGLPQDPDDIPF
jgi:hypothetical protein